MLGTFWTGIGDYRDGVLYQRLFGMSYIKTKYGKFKIINVKKQDGSQDTKLVFNEQTVYLLPGKLINFTNNADNVVAGTSDGSVFWWQQIDGKWQYKPFVLVPEKIKLAKAIDEKIEDLKSSISVYNSNQRICLLLRLLQDFCFLGRKPVQPGQVVTDRFMNAFLCFAFIHCDRRSLPVHS